MSDKRPRCAPLEHNYQVYSQTVPVSGFQSYVQAIMYCTKCGHYFNGPKSETFSTWTNTWSWKPWTPISGSGTYTITNNTDYS